MGTTEAADNASATSIADKVQPGEMMVEELAYRRLSPFWTAVFCTLTVIGIFLTLNQLLNLQFFIRVVLLDNRYLFLLGGIFLSLIFLAYPLRASELKTPVPWYDTVAFAATLAVTGYFAWNGNRILSEGWEYAAPTPAIVVSAIAWVLVIEGTRRAGGIVLAVIIALMSLYPVVAEIMPGPISGKAQPLGDTLAYHMLSSESTFGIPMRAFAEIVVGFIIFGVVLNYTGGGKFFNDIAFALVGGWRGGAAQVGVISSGLQGSISGSVISNVVSSGVVTIPAMKRTGFSAAYAGGVEAVASTGGVLMPPVMGSTAFVMASFLGMPYGEIALAAAVPALLFYFGLVVQIDAYSARSGLRGLPKSELPRIGPAFREGWIYLLVFIVLVVFMLNEQQEALAPFYATALLLIVNQILPRWRFNLATAIEALTATGRGLAELVAILLGAGLIIGPFTVTGLAGTLANDLVYLAGNSPLVLLVMGAITSFIFGLGMTATACYIFLAIVLAPPLVKAGLDPLAIHMFIFYWGMVSFITPPVALGAFAAAAIARTNQWAVGWESMRLGSVIYFIPFFFVLNPALILHGTWTDIVLSIAAAAIGIVFIAAGLQGWLAGVGDVGRGPGGLARRLALIAAGFGWALPSMPVLGIPQWQTALAGTALAIIVAMSIRARAGSRRQRFHL